MKAMLQKAAKDEEAAYKALQAARRNEEVKGRVMEALMRRIGRSMKEKGYNGSKWERKLQLAEEKWVSSRLEAQAAFGNVAVCTACTLSWKLVM